MNDDIVTRLREELDGPAMTVTRQDVREVLAEIESLREQNEYLKANVEMLLAEARAVRGE